MAETKDQVWQYMLSYQHARGMPPKMDEIVAAHGTLNYRSSVRYAFQSLLNEGRVVEIDDAGTARRYRAVPDREGTDTRVQPDDLACHFVPVETLEV
jgi:hypothetical protein